MLDECFIEPLSDCEVRVQETSVSMSLDGWSNVHNEPILCLTISTSDGYSFLADTIDTSGHSHTSEYLLEKSNLVVVAVLHVLLPTMQQI